jgi:hypothetical protein
MDFVRSLSVSETERFISQSWTYGNGVTLTALTRAHGRDLCQDKVNLIFQRLCDSGSTLEIQENVESLMSDGRYPDGMVLAKCAQRGEMFLERYMRRWPLDRLAVQTALERQLRAKRQTLEFDQAVANYKYLVTHAERPALYFLFCALIYGRAQKVEDEMLWRFIAAVKAHYDLSEASSVRSTAEYEIIASTYLPCVATDEFLQQKLSSFLEGDPIPAAELPKFLEQNGDGNSIEHALDLTCSCCTVV